MYELSLQFIIIQKGLLKLYSILCAPERTKYLIVLGLRLFPSIQCFPVLPTACFPAFGFSYGDAYSPLVAAYSLLAVASFLLVVVFVIVAEIVAEIVSVDVHGVAQSLGFRSGDELLQLGYPPSFAFSLLRCLHLERAPLGCPCH